MTRFFLSIYDWLVKRKTFAALILAVCLIFCVFKILNLHYQEDIAEFLPQTEQNKKYASVYEQMGGQSRIVVIFLSPSANQDSIVAAIDGFAENWAAADTNRSVTETQFHIDETIMLDVMDFVQQNYPYFLTVEDYARMDSLLLQPNYVATQLDANKQLLMLPTGGTMAGNIKYDPLHLFTPVLQRLRSFQLSEKYSVYEGCIFADEGRRGLAFITSPYGISESEKNNLLAKLLNTVIEKTKTENPRVEISAVGAPLIAVTNATQIKRDSLLAISLSVLLIFILLYLSFRRLSDILWIGVSLVLGWIIALGFMAIFKNSISIIVLGIGSIIIGIAVNYPLHFLDHLKHESNMRQSLREIVSPLVVGNITTVSAFLSLAFMNADAMRDLGIFGSLVLIATILFVIIFLPLFAKNRRNVKNKPHAIFGAISSLQIERKKGFAWPIAIITIVLLWFSFRTTFDTNMQHINYMTAEQRRDMAFLSESFQNQGCTRLFAVAEGENLQSALANNEQMQTQIIKLKKENKIQQFSGIGDFLPSAQNQKNAIERWRAFWANKNHAAAIITLQQEAKTQGFSANAFDHFYKMISQDLQPQPEAYFETLTNNLAANYIVKSNGNVKIVNLLQVLDIKSDSVKAELNNNAQNGSFVFDKDDVGLQLVSVLSNDFNYIGYACGFIVFFFLWLSFGRLELSLLSFLPLAVSWIWILGIMGLCNIQFNIVNIILATFIFGQGDDYTIFITEGLIYEYAYNKKVLNSYKNSVALSAIIMFVGIGTLIIAKHPAMRSLAEVTIIGMFTVLLMAYYLPPLIFRWLTTRKGEKRQVPITMRRLARSLFAISFFAISVFCFFIPFTFFYFLFGKRNDKKKLWYHKMLRRVSSFAIKHVPGVKFSLNNKSEEKFDKPAVIVCNHQSHLDIMCLMMLNPKIVILTNDWAWSNPFYGQIIKNAEFYPVSKGLDDNEEHISALVKKGYSVVIFPEGTRSTDCSILHFHRGAFYLAEKLGIDILPVFIHGAGHVLPKNDFMLRAGEIYVEINERVDATKPMRAEGYRKASSEFHKYYINHFEEIRNLRETARYCAVYVRYKYLYKGYSVENECKKTLNKISQYEKYINCDYVNAHVIWIINSGQGEIAWLFALVQKNIDIYAFETDEEKYALSVNCQGIPANLHFCKLLQIADAPQPDACFIINGSQSDMEKYKKFNIQNIQLQ